MSPSGLDTGNTRRKGRRIPDFPNNSNTQGNPLQPIRATQNNNTKVDSPTIQNNDIVAGSPTQKNATATITPSIIADGSPTLNNASTEPNHNDIVDGIPTQINAPNIRQRRPRNRRRKHNSYILPTAVPSIPPPTPSLQQAQNQNYETLLKRISNLDITNDGTITHMQPFGDPMTADAQWPNPGDRSYIRMYLINTNGISYYNDYLDWEMSLGFLHDMQVDIFGLTEPNLDFSQPSVRYSIMEKTRQVDKFMDLNMSSAKYTSKQPGHRTPFKMGGTITG